MRPLFVSYRHTEADWVKNHLVPVLEAGGSEVLRDTERFRAGPPVKGQMDAEQDKAQATVAVVTPSYFESDYCVHELERAQAKSGHELVPVIRDGEIPASLKHLLCVDLRPPENVEQWGLLLDSCDAPLWSLGLQQAHRYVQNGGSLNVITNGHSLWRPFITRVKRLAAPDNTIGEVDFDRPQTYTQRGLVKLLLAQCGIAHSLQDGEDELVVLDTQLTKLARPAAVTLLHLDHVARPGRQEAYSDGLFYALRYLTRDARKLTLLVQSDSPFDTLVRQTHPVSKLLMDALTLRSSPRP